MPEKEEQDETIYDSGGREEAIDEGGIRPEEEAFMRGYEEAEEGEEKKEDEEEEENKEKEEE